MSKDEPDPRFVSVLRMELERRATIREGKARRSTESYPASRWRVSIVTFATGLVVAAVAVAVILGVNGHRDSSPPAGATSGTGGAGTVLRASKSDAKLVVSGVSPNSSDQVVFIGDEFTLNLAGCVQWGKTVVVALPGSSIAEDGKHVTLVLSNGSHHTYPLGRRIAATIGGSPLSSGSKLLPSQSVICGTKVDFGLVQ